MAIAPAFALGDGNRNLLLIGAMGVSPYFFIRYPIVIPKVDICLGSICLLMIIFPLLFHSETMRWSTVLYSCMFCIYFMAFARVLYSNDYEFSEFSELLKGLIYAYCIVLVIQQFCVLTGLPIFNVSNYSPLEPWKLNSLTAEPSHSGRIISILMLFYILCQERILHVNYVLKERFNEDRWVWLAYLWTVLTMGSATAFIFFFIIILKLVPNLKRSKTIFLIMFIGCILFELGHQNKNVSRAVDFTQAVLTLDERQVIKADGSGAHRIVSSFRGAKFISIDKFYDWVGYGVDADQTLVSNFQAGLDGSAGMFQIWVNFGLIVCILWWIFSFQTIYNSSFPIVSILIWLLTVLIVGGINNQILWLVLLVTYTYKSIGKASSETVIYNHIENYQSKEL